MSMFHRISALTIVVATMALNACTDAPSAPTSAAPMSAVASKGVGGGSGGGGGGGGRTGGGGGGTQLLITTAPTVSATGVFAGTVIGPVPAGAARTVTMNLTQSATGFISGTVANRTIDGTLEPVVGTVNGDTLAVYIGNVCGACTLEPIFNGSVAPDGSQISGSLLVLSSTAFVATKQ